MQTTVTTGGKTSIPAELRKKYSIEDQTKLEWIDDDTALRILPIPKDPIAFYRGKSKGKNMTEALLEARRVERYCEKNRPRK